MTRIPRVCVAAGASGAGKTAFTCALLRALTNAGKRPASFKAGPDYIDPMFHEKALGIPGANLDLYLMDEKTAALLLREHGEGRDIAVLEGVMGFYDGIGAVSPAGSTWDLARATNTPVVLVEDCRGMSLSIVPRIKGLSEFRVPSGIGAVVLNRASGKLYPRLKQAVEDETGIPVAGYLPYLPECRIESRHLGLVTAFELADIGEKIDRLAASLAAHVDMALITALAESAPLLDAAPPLPHTGRFAGVKVAVARDRAFCFYYKDNLALLEKLGAELAYFSPLSHTALPEGTQGLYLGGGYPELYAGELAGNRRLLAAVREALDSGLPCIAECGGFMYLHSTLVDANGKSHALVGFLPGSCAPQKGLVRFGYAAYTAQRDTVLCAKGETLRGHEFHYWESDAPGDAFVSQKPFTPETGQCAVAGETLYAGFPHFHFYTNPAMASRFLQKSAAYHPPPPAGGG
ncbi:MAG: cobyrinate a,c-diamide synthase [Spirochaetaceae bacterium]|jgi:cobyrinic acid a,c-diamide synthase|nr:cobyrinate a,c-diamide synthase [Spirochaetaceae bacterium]